ncbi:transcription termination factor Rho [Microlunatus spumicola]
MSEASAQAAVDGPAEGGARKRRGSGLDSMVLPELKQLASSLGLKGTGAMRKGQLISAIQSAQTGGSNGGSSSSSSSNGGSTNGGSSNEAASSSGGDAAEAGSGGRRRRSATRAAGEPTVSDGGESRGGETRRGDEIANALHELRENAPQAREASAPAERQTQGDANGAEQQSGRQDGGQERSERRDDGDRDGNDGERRQRNRDGQRDDRQQNDRQQDRQRDDRQQDRQRDDRQQGDRQQDRQQDRQRDDRQGDRQRDDRQQNDRQGQRDGSGGQQRDTGRNAGGQSQQNRYDDDDEGGGRRGRRRRSRDRQNRRPGTTGRSGGMDRYENEPTVSEDDVLVPARGILDVMDSYAFVRTSGYLPSPEDAYVSLAMVKKFGLRKGDVVTGQLRQSKEGDSKAKFNPLVKLETVNGGDPEAARNRPEFAKLTPLYPQERLKLETTSTQLATRIVDLMAPIGKGQRALIVSPPKAGKTMMMQSIANAIAANNPEVHLMVVLVDERPEEVTDFQRTVKGEVIASTFDRPAGDHTTVAELAIERAKRLVEAGKDVVVLLDGITRLSRAYNLAAPASGRILSGGVDSAALYPPKRFLGAARNIEGGGSLTILATALIETGSKMDEVIFEEFKGTGNSEIRLRREFAEKRIFPAIDVDASSTRREELLMSREELNIVWKLRRVIGGLDSLQGLETLLDRLKKTESNRDFMVAITKSMPA